ncbi:hypothetical protein N9H82_03565 [Flavobacteriaceae bacterium]|jgi:hypothetical protein|nr:hypothetical protein [Flavobacteriaceae bacterium]
MAINVDQVYKTVLLIINKEQRGYLTPNEFNKLATQVQLEIIDGYFEAINQQMRLPQNDSEYADRYKSVQEKLDAFKDIGSCAFTAATLTEPAFFTPPSSSGVASGTQTFATTTTTISYPLTTITQAQVENSNVVVTLETPTGSAGVAYANFTITGGALQLTAGAIATGNTLRIVLYPQDFYKLGTVLYKNDKAVEPVQRNELALLNLSTITKPSEYFPVYLFNENKIIIHPQTIVSNVEATYVRKPADVMWNFDSTAGYYVYDPTTSVNFELAITEQANVVLQILLYAGVVIKDPMIIQAASAEIQRDQQNERT